MAGWYEDYANQLLNQRSQMGVSRGGIPTPQEDDYAMSMSLDSATKKQASDRSLSIQEQSLANQTRSTDASIRQTDASIQNMSDTLQMNKDKASSDAMGNITKLGVTALTTSMKDSPLGQGLNWLGNKLLPGSPANPAIPSPVGQQPGVNIPTPDGEMPVGPQGADLGTDLSTNSGIPVGPQGADLGTDLGMPIGNQGADLGTDLLGSATGEGVNVGMAAGSTAEFGVTSTGEMVASSYALTSAGVATAETTAFVSSVVGADVSSEFATAFGVMAAQNAAAIGTFFEGLVALCSWVLCSELVRQGKLDSRIVDDEWSYISGMLTIEEYLGYRIIADPLVRVMQKSKLFTWVMTPFIRGFAYEMASRVNDKVTGSKLGKFVLWWGLPLCRIAYAVSNRKEVRHEFSR